MKRLIRGMIGLSLAAGLTACDNDPSLDFGGEPTMVQANPSVMFINRGATKEVLVRLVNDRNQSIPAQFELSNVGTGISVALDENYRPNNIADYLDVPAVKEQHRYFVTANALVSTTFTLSNGGISSQVRVNVLPTELLAVSATGGNGTTEAGNLTSESMIYTDQTRFEVNGVELPYQGTTDDGTTARVVLPAGVSDSLKIIGAAIAYAPTVPLATMTLTTGLFTTGGTATPLAGVNTIETAPTITLSESGPYGFADNGAFTGGGANPVKFYKIIVPADRGPTRIVLDWLPGAANADLDVFLLDENHETLAAAEAGNSTTVPPEIINIDALPAGTYYIEVLNYQNRQAPNFVTVNFRNQP